MKDRFVQLLLDSNRTGADILALHLERNTDFFSAPASTAHHGARKGGLLEHSLAVYDRLLEINQAHRLGLPYDSMIICGLLHDLCKANYYTLATKNVKNETTGKWDKEPYYTVSDQFPFGHGEKSAILISRFMYLSDVECLAIRFHMGGFDDAARGGYSGSMSMNTAMRMDPLIVALHLADMAASYFSRA